MSEQATTPPPGDPVPFHIDLPEETLADLRARLARTRWPDASPHPGWVQGSPLDATREWARRWSEDFDWRAEERALDAMEHYRVALDGQWLHFVHARSPHPEARPLLIQHGWPGSFVEFRHLLPLLLDPVPHGGAPGDAFHVVAPSIPGYAFSDPPARPGMDPWAVGERLVRLMTDVLGYERFALQGGDWGAVITSAIAFTRPERIIGLHLNMQGLRAATGGDAPPLSGEEKAYLAHAREVFAEDMAYFAIQSTRPQSLGYGLNDSPAGLLAWLLEKFTAWTDCDGVLERAVRPEDFLANLTLYWATGTITSAMRLYWEHVHGGRGTLAPGRRVEVPTALAVFPKEIFTPPRAWVERAYRIEQWTEMPRGGHFAALEQPRLLAEDMWRFFRGR